jgi:hypothetical protein
VAGTDGGHCPTRFGKSRYTLKPATNVWAGPENEHGSIAVREAGFDPERTSQRRWDRRCPKGLIPTAQKCRRASRFAFIAELESLAPFNDIGANVLGLRPRPAEDRPRRVRKLHRAVPRWVKSVGPWAGSR